MWVVDTYYKWLVNLSALSFNLELVYDRGILFRITSESIPNFVIRYITFKSYLRLFILMNRTILIALTLALSSGLMAFVLTGMSLSYGQQNQTSNTTSTQPQQNQTTEIGSASDIENMTAGNIRL